MKSKDSVEYLRNILSEVRDRLPIVDQETVEELLNVGEPGVALEILCTQIYEHDIQVPPRIILGIAKIGEMIGLDNSYWLMLDAD